MGVTRSKPSGDSTGPGPAAAKMGGKARTGNRDKSPDEVQGRTASGPAHAPHHPSKPAEAHAASAKPAPVKGRQPATEAPARVEPARETPKAQAAPQVSATAPRIEAQRPQAAKPEPPARPVVPQAPRIEPAKPVVKPAAAEPPKPVAKPAAAEPARPVVGVAIPAQPDVTASLHKLEQGMKALEGQLGERLSQIQKTLTTIDGRAARAAAQPAEQRSPGAIDAELDQVARSMKRSLVEAFERSGERIAAPVAKVVRYLDELRKKAEGEAPGFGEHLGNCLESLSAVLQDLGVETFEAEDGEYFDPIIHQCVGEERRAGRDDGLVARSVSPGFRSPAGHVLLPALVIVHRK